MRLNRRQFIWGLLATAATAAVAPQAPVESVHGASDLTPRERDVAADVMGLRTEQWAGWGADDDDLPPVCWDGYTWGEMMLRTFDQWAESKGVAPGRAAAMRDAIAKEYGLRQEQWAGWSAELARDSVIRLYNFGISTPDVRDRAEFLWATEGTDRRGAFKQAVMEQGRAALDNERDRQILEGVPGGQMPSGVINEGSDQDDVVREPTLN